MVDSNTTSDTTDIEEPAAGLPMPDENQVNPVPADRASMSRQLLQLVVIPAIIVLAAAAISYPIMRLFSLKGTVESHLAALERQGGLENDKWRAIHALNSQLASLNDPRQQAKFNEQMVRILNRASSGAGKKDKLHMGLILLLGQLERRWDRISLGERLRAVRSERQMTQADVAVQLGVGPDEVAAWEQNDAGVDSDSSMKVLAWLDNLDTIVRHAQSPHALIRQGAVQCIQNWPNVQRARTTLDLLSQLAADPDVQVRGFAATALGRFATVRDRSATDALVQLMESDDVDDREASWDAAIALARLGGELAQDEQWGSAMAKANRIVSGLLLDRDALDQVGMDLGEQSHIIFLTLISAAEMTEKSIWDKIKQLANNDSNVRIRTEAKSLWHEHRRSSGSD